MSDEAEAADLTYYLDTEPGLRRLKTRAGFRYVYPGGRPVRADATLKRIRGLVIPPAWRDVWICPEPGGHLQATGRDARGRKQYRYHTRWREVRDASKYDHTIAFGKALPRIRDRVAADLSRPGLPREKVLAAAVALLQTTLIRVGNREYERDNKSFGLTTLRKRHVAVSGTTLRFEFRGKSGKQHSVSIRDRRLANVVRRCQELKGQHLFQYIDAAGERHAIGSSDVNAYLREASGGDFSAKDYRTWTGTVLAAMALASVEPFESDAEAKREVVQAIDQVAKSLGNTPAVCRKCYVHPDVVEAFMAGGLASAMRRRGSTRLVEAGLAPEEAAVLSLLRARQRERASERRAS